MYVVDTKVVYIYIIKYTLISRATTQITHVSVCLLTINTIGSDGSIDMLKEGECVLFTGEAQLCGNE